MIKKKLLYIVIFLVVYISFVAGTILYDSYLENKLATFDSNGDSIFSPEEQTAEQQEYMNRVTNDLGRNLMPIYVIFISLAFVFFCSKVLKPSSTVNSLFKK